MKFISKNLKFASMRKEQSFICYPVLKNDETFLIQSDTRILRIDLNKTELAEMRILSIGITNSDGSINLF